MMKLHSLNELIVVSIAHLAPILKVKNIFKAPKRKVAYRIRSKLSKRQVDILLKGFTAAHRNAPCC